MEEEEQLGDGEVEVPKYEDLKTEESERPIDLEEEEISKTLSEQEEETEQISDLKVIAKYLHPQYKDKRLNELLQSAASSRIYTDNLLDKNFLLSMSYIEEHEGEKDIDVVGYISMIQDALSRGIEGRQRIEDLELAGVVHEEEVEKLARDLGM